MGKSSVSRSGVVALADQVRLRQVLRNLLSNAVRYGGKSIDVSLHSDGTNAYVRMADNGPGVPAGERELSSFLTGERPAVSTRTR